MKKIVVNRNEFLKTIVPASSMANKNKINILENVKIMVQNTEMRIVSNDGEIAISQGCPIVEADENVKFCINPKDLISYVRLLNDENITFNIDFDKWECVIEYAQGKTTLPIFDAEDFPIPTKEDGMQMINMPSAILSDILNISSSYLGREDLRPILSCLYMEVDNSSLCYCATDARMMITNTIHYDFGDIKPFNTLIHINAFKPLMDILKLCDTITMKIGERQVIFSNATASLSCLLVEGKFPAFKSIIPKSFNMEINDVDTHALVGAMERCKLTNDNVKITFTKDNGMNMASTGLVVGKTTSENIPCSCDQDLLIGFHTDNLMRAFSGVNDGKCVLHLIDECHAMVIKDANPDKIVLIMPIRLAN